MQANQNNSKPRQSPKEPALEVVFKHDKLFNEKNSSKVQSLLSKEISGSIHKYKKNKDQVTDDELMDENDHGNIL